jgi:hypothetical protein
MRSVCYIHPDVRCDTVPKLRYLEPQGKWEVVETETSTAAFFPGAVKESTGKLYSIQDEQDQTRDQQNGHHPR